jgi:hypothetical protein
LKPGFYANAKLLLIFGAIDREMRKTFLSFLGALIKNPLHFFKKVSVQSILVLQPQDVLPSGKQDLCDGCPNKTIHNGRLVSMCRTEEFISFGDMITLKKKEAVASQSNTSEIPLKPSPLAGEVYPPPAAPKATRDLGGGDHNKENRDACQNICE